MSNFSGLAMSRMEMKKVKGGSCHLWHINSAGEYHVAPNNLSKEGAQRISAGLVRDYGAGFGWCCDSGC